MLSATATRLRPRRQPEIRRRSGGTVSDPTGAQVQSATADMLDAAGRLAELARAAVRVRETFGLETSGKVARAIVDLGADTDDVERCRRVGPTSPRFAPAVTMLCKFVGETVREVRGWWVGQRDLHGRLYADDGGQAAAVEAHDLDRAWAAVRVADEACRLAGWLRPHERPDLGQVAPGFRWCGCGEPTCERVTRPGEGRVHGACRKRMSRERKTA